MVMSHSGMTLEIMIQEKRTKTTSLSIGPFKTTRNAYSGKEDILALISEDQSWTNPT